MHLNLHLALDHRGNLLVVPITLLDRLIFNLHDLLLLFVADQNLFGLVELYWQKRQLLTFLMTRHLREYLSP